MKSLILKTEDDSEYIFNYQITLITINALFRTYITFSSSSN